jgi:ADP-ribosylglycohydrolase
MDRLTGTLLGTAVGDALGLPAEGLSAADVRRRWGRLDRYRLLGPWGFVSDDTEQSALVAQSLARFPADPELCADEFRRALVGWFWRLPWGVGLATVRASLKATFGLRPSGVRSAGNGAAMRAAVVGVYFREDAARRRAFSEALARVTHLDERAVQAAVFVADTAAATASGLEPSAALGAGAAGVRERELAAALGKAKGLAGAHAAVEDAAEALGTSGYSVQTAAFAYFLFARFGSDPRACLVETASAGGDTDSIGAVVGGWLGALHGKDGLPADLVEGLCGGPFGRAHLERLGAALALKTPPPRYVWPLALARNLALMPVILAHGFRRLLP